MMLTNECCSDDTSLKSFKLNPFNALQFLLLVVIRLYQKLISPFLPKNTCRFYPSCSQYGFQAIYKFGALKGSFLAIKRILRCNPFNEGGYDPIP